MITNKELMLKTKDMFLGDVFIRQALDFYSQQVLQDGLADWPEFHIIHKDEWLRLAQKVQDLLIEE